ncbi:hypothetical protein [Methylobacterium sp. A54F]
MTHSPAAGALVPDRSCGACTACCRILEIAALGKPAGVLCRHNTGAACGIYDERPLACERWHCLWRRIGAMPDALRPDRCGVVFSLERRPPVAAVPEEACIVGRAVDDPRALDRSEVIAAFAMFVREGSLPVWKASDQSAAVLDGPA